MTTYSKYGIPRLLLVIVVSWLVQACSLLDNDDDDDDIVAPSPAVPSLSISNAAISEGDADTQSLSFAVRLSSANNELVTVDYSTNDVTAVAGTDYLTTNGTLSFLAGEVSKTISVIVLGDTEDEANETFTVSLSNATNAPLNVTQAIGTIIDDDGSSQSGLDQRPSNATCLAPARPTGGTSIATQQVFGRLPAFSAPVAFMQAPGDDSRWFVVEQAGRVLVFANSVGVNSTSIFIDISNRVDDGPNEAGLLGMAFHPDFETNGQVFLSYTRSGSPLVSFISRFSSADNGQTLDPNSEEVILTVDQTFGNHNGGNIAFGPDGLLYIGFGDGGSGGDPRNDAQNINSLLGAMLRIDVDAGVPYAIPVDNPFANSGSCASGNGCPEIYAWGFRNPWRWSFDRNTGELWVGDVGQNSLEEIDRVERGGNYGWRCYEGNSAFNTNGCQAANNYVFPITEYNHSLGNSITGGYVYRGTAITNLQGVYLFADFGSGRVWGLAGDDQGVPVREELLNTSFGISSFGEGNDGELYVLDYSSGRVHQIVAGTTSGNNSIPIQLSQTGCVLQTDPTQPAPGLVPYTVNAPFWSDGAIKQRWLALPDGSHIDIGVDGDWELPIGSVIMKHFSITGQLIETRLFMRHPDGEWGGYSYEWNDALTDARLVVGGKTKVIGNQTWVFPSSAQCLQCHTVAAGRTLGLENAQLNGDLTYPSTGRTANQLTTLESIAIFSAALPDTPENLAALSDPFDSNLAIVERAHAYMHTNCSQCHRPGGPTNVNMDVRFDTAARDMNVCNVPPQGPNLGIPNVLRLAPGEPSRSLVSLRARRRDIHGMPPLATTVVDDQGMALIDQWIATLVGCP